MSELDEDAPQPGQAAERTDLAWNRSGLALLACGVAVMRGLGHANLVPARTAVGVSVLTLGLAAWIVGGVQARRRSRAGHARQRATAADLLPVVIGTVVVGVAAFVLAAFFPA